MASSPVEFAAAFERLRTHAGATDAGDGALLQLLDFWPKLAPLAKNPAYSSYVTEYLAFLESSLTENNLCDLSLAELAGLESLGTDVGAREPLLQSIRKQIARQCFFVGKLGEGLSACLRITREDVAIETSDDSAGGLSEYETFHAFVLAFDEKWPATKKLLQELAEEWQAEREFVSTDRIYCLFVQNNGVGERSRGKLRALSGSVEERSRSAQNDEITFDNQLRASDDPIVGVAYQALTATRRYLKSTGYSRLGTSYYHAHLAVTDKRAVYTGDSIGVATALLAYAQLLHTEALRHDHLLPGDVACTGGIDEAGTVTPVNGDSLHAKVERAFFSHIKYLALPSENVASARQHLDTLQPSYPARQLILLPVASLSAAVNDHNIIRPEKVCIGEFVAKKAVKYSRSTKVQVPMLMVLAYLLLCVIYPKAWILFDWEPASIKLEGHSFVALNRNGHETFTYESRCNPIDSLSVWTIGDLDGDKKKEVLLIPRRADGRECMEDHQEHEYNQLIVLTRRGKTLFSRNCVVPNEYPNDTSSNQPYFTNPPFIIDFQNHKQIMTSVCRSYPGRNHFRFFSAKGDSIGWYIDAGSNFTFQDCLALDRSGNAAIVGYNNRVGAASLAILPPDSSRGVAPPYTLPFDKPYTQGNQLAYFVFPKTDLNVKLKADYNHPHGIQIEPDGALKIDIDESSGEGALLSYQFDRNYKLQDVLLSDHFILMRKSLVLNGELEDIDEGNYRAMLLGSVKTWHNGGWIAAPQSRKD